MQIIIKSDIIMTLETGVRQTYTPSDDVLTIDDVFAKENNLKERFEQYPNHIEILKPKEAIKKTVDKPKKNVKKNVVDSTKGA